MSNPLQVPLLFRQHALKNEENDCQQKIDGLVTEIHRLRAIQVEDRKLYAEVLANVAKASHLPFEAMNQYVQSGKEFIKAGA